MAFFDLGDNESPAPSANTPSWVNHIALEVPHEDDLQRARVRLEADGIEVLGVTDHHFVRSIYCFDPNGLRVELTVRTSTQQMERDFAAQAHAQLAEWSRERSHSTQTAA